MNINLTRQIPQAFQQWLSAEKTPTLCEATRSFSAITEVWKEYQDQHPETSNIVQAGIVTILISWKITQIEHL